MTYAIMPSDVSQLSDMDQRAICDYVSRTPSGNYIAIRGDTWDGVTYVVSLHSMSEEELQDYYNSGGIWHYSPRDAWL